MGKTNAGCILYKINIYHSFFRGIIWLMETFEVNFLYACELRQGLLMPSLVSCSELLLIQQQPYNRLQRKD